MAGGAGEEDDDDGVDGHLLKSFFISLVANPKLFVTSSC
jgi:hypothetical protein